MSTPCWRTVVPMIVLLALAAPPSSALTAMQLVQRALAQQEAVRDYTATVRVSVSAPSLQIPERRVKVYFKRPDKVRVDSQGLAILPRDALLWGNLGRHLAEATSATVVGQGELQGRPVTCVKLVPREAAAGAGRVLCWVDSQRHLLAKMEVWRDNARALTVSFDQVLVQQRYYLPSHIDCRLADGALGRRGGGGPATMQLDFSDYRVNVGLRDALFDEDEG